MASTSSKFISPYQGRVYEVDYEGNPPMDYVNGEYNFKVFREYFSEGFREYYQNPHRLAERDNKLYVYIKELNKYAG